jgi:hypothetical protein
VRKHARHGERQTRSASQAKAKIKGAGSLAMANEMDDATAGHEGTQTLEYIPGCWWKQLMGFDRWVVKSWSISARDEVFCNAIGKTLTWVTALTQTL